MAIDKRDPDVSADLDHLRRESVKVIALFVMLTGFICMQLNVWGLSIVTVESMGIEGGLRSSAPASSWRGLDCQQERTARSVPASHDEDIDLQHLME